MCGSFLDPAPQGNVVSGGIDVIPVNKPVSTSIIQLVIKHCSPPILDAILEGRKEKNNN